MTNSMSRTHYLAGAIVATLVASFAVPAFALDVSGPIAGDSVWAAGDSPVRVVGDVEVAQGASLTIEAGVNVVFTGPYSLTVRGTLAGVGSRPARITFTAED